MQKKPWTGEAETILKRLAGKCPADEIAKKTGYSERTIRRHMERLRLEPFHPTRWKMSRKDRLFHSAAGLDAPEPD